MLLVVEYNVVQNRIKWDRQFLRVDSIAFGVSVPHRGPPEAGSRKPGTGTLDQKQEVETRMAKTKTRTRTTPQGLAGLAGPIVRPRRAHTGPVEPVSPMATPEPEQVATEAATAVARVLPPGLAPVFYENPDMYWSFPPEYRPRPVEQVPALTADSQYGIQPGPPTRGERRVASIVRRQALAEDLDRPGCIAGDSPVVAVIRRWVDRYGSIRMFSERTGIAKSTVCKWMSASGHRATPRKSHIKVLLEIARNPYGPGNVPMPGDRDLVEPVDVETLAMALLPTPTSLGGFSSDVHRVLGPGTMTGGSRGKPIYWDSPVMDLADLELGREAIRYCMDQFGITLHRVAKVSGVGYYGLWRYMHNTTHMPFRSMFRALAGWIAGMIKSVDKDSPGYAVWSGHMVNLVRLATMRRRESQIQRKG